MPAGVFGKFFHLLNGVITGLRCNATYLKFSVHCRRCFVMLYQAWGWGRRLHNPNHDIELNGDDDDDGDRALCEENGHHLKKRWKNGGSRSMTYGRASYLLGVRNGSITNGDLSCTHNHSLAAAQLRSLNEELGISLHGDPSPEVILRDLDPQSMILCGLNNNSSGNSTR